MLQQKKVLFLSPMPPPAGGIATWTKRIMATQLPGGWGKGLVDTKVIRGRSVFSGKKRYFDEIVRALNIFAQLFSKLLDRSFLVVHINCSGSSQGMLRDIFCALISSAFCRKVVVHYRCTTSVVIVGGVSRFFFKTLNRLASGVITLNQSSLQDASINGASKVWLIPNFIDSELFNSLDRICVRNAVERVIFVGGGVVSKGCGVLIDAARELPNIEFLIVGSRSSWLDGQDLSSNVKIIGEVEYKTVLELLATSDIFLFPTFFPAEGFANALLEAMACGLPCVATDWAANADMLEREGGIVVPILDVGAVVSGIKDMSDSSRRSAMSAWNIRKVSEFYLDVHVLSQYARVYDQACAKKL